MCATNKCPICQYYKSVFGSDDPLLRTMRMRSVCKKHRSIDDDWEDSSSVVPEPAPEVKPFVMPPLDGSVKMRILKPVEKYYYTTRVHNLDGTVTPQVMCVGKTLHEKMMKAMVPDDGEDSAG